MQDYMRPMLRRASGQRQVLIYKWLWEHNIEWMNAIKNKIGSQNGAGWRTLFAELS